MDESRTGAPCGKAPAADGAQTAVAALAQGARSARSAVEASAPLHGGSWEARALPADENNGYATRIEEAYGRMRRKGTDSLRPVFHLSPLAGTLADPNGLTQVGDTYHIFHLNNPLGCETSERTPCVWAHWTTRDFVRYRREPVALYPDTARDRDGVYSGSALVRAGAVYLYYTGNVRHRGDYDYVHAGREQNVMRADPSPASHSRRNVCFGEKRLLMTNDDFPARMTQHVRDPQLVGRDGATMMLLGARTQDDEGCVLVYRALDDAPAGAPSRFALAGMLATPEPFGYMWECPDLVALAGREFLLACPQGIPHERWRYQNAHQCGYFALEGSLAQAVGEKGVPADGAAAEKDMRRDEGGARRAAPAAPRGGDEGTPVSLVPVGAFTQWDYGFDFYATRTLRCADGRVLLVGWMGMPDAPYGRTPSADRGWDQVLAMPRELVLRDGRICQRPLRELASLRGEAVRLGAPAASGGRTFHARSFELDVRPERPDADLVLCLREDAEIRYRAAERELVLRMGPVCGAGRDERRMRVGDEGLTRLRLFVDASTLELFVNDGCATMTSRIFGEDDATSLKGFHGEGVFYQMAPFVITEA